MAYKLKVGDRIRNTSLSPGNTNYGQDGIVIRIISESNNPYSIKYDHGGTGQGGDKDYTFIGTTKQTLMSKISTIAKRLLDADTNTLVKAGYLDSELNLTDEGEEVLFALLLEANKTVLVTEAQSKLDEEKAAKN